jgi:hypothetical protein
MSAARLCSTHKNFNSYSGIGTLGLGIYCTPNSSNAENYSANKSYDNKYLCILQCRVNPKAIKISSDSSCLLNNSPDIKPYKLLIKKR